MDDIRIVSDFLPSPAELAFREESVKVTISLSKKSIDFFKKEASKHHTQYQRMIRQLLDSYAETQSDVRTTRASGQSKKLRAA
jgi:predicted DNA binding CopG/RHH family protein